MTSPGPIGPPPPVPDPVGLLRRGEMELLGRLIDASNATFLCRVTEPCPDPEPDQTVTAVYKPVRGERPLEDFPRWTLANREVAAYLTSEAMGWSVVPPTVLREGPHGPGAVQLWIERDATVDPLDRLRERDPALRRMALFDAVVNNADRKVGHLLPIEGHVFGVDHGICFSAEPKLRTVLWVWRGDRLTADEVGALEELERDLRDGLGIDLSELLAPYEIQATRDRVRALIDTRRFPQPIPGQPAIPWPPY